MTQTDFLGDTSMRNYTPLTAGKYIFACPLDCMAAEKTSLLRDKAQALHFDDGSFELMVDNCASRSITNDRNDYLTPPTPSKTQI